MKILFSNRRAWLGVTILVAAAVFCLAAEVVDRIVAVVGDEVITWRELETAYLKEMAAMKLEPAPGGTVVFPSREEFLDRMIEKKLIEQEVKRQGIQVDALEVEQAIDRKRESLGLTEEEFERALRREGLTMDQYREEVRNQLITFRLISREVRGEIEITDEEIENYYRQHPEKFMQRESYHLYHIFIPFPPSGSAEGVKTKLEGIREEILAGASFEEMARTYSQSPTASAGGDLGWFTMSELLPVFQEQVKMLSPAQLSPVFVHQGGAHLLLLREIRPGELLPLEKVRADIRDQLYQQEAMERYELWLGRLKARSYIENRLKQK